METAVTETFWSDLGGMIACQKHMGMEARAKLQSRPSAKSITTSMTKWIKMTDQEASEFSELIGADHTICESCRFSAR